MKGVTKAGSWQGKENWGKAFLFSFVVLGIKTGSNLACLLSQEKRASGRTRHNRANG